MKSYKKLLALAIVLVMMLALTAPAMATGADDPSTGGEGGSTTTVNITINRDSSYDENATGDRVYTWYKVFTAIPADTLSGTGGGHDDAGAPGEISYGTTPPAVAYKASSTIAAKLGSWNATDKTWTRTTGNNWFDLIPIAGQTNYTVKWAAEATDSAAAQAAAVWLLANGVYESSGNLTWNATDKAWTASGLDAGYYLISGSEGLNLVAATTNITIDEKNTYPTVEKTQKDADTSDYTADPVNVAVGDTIFYQVEVTVPHDMNKDIVLTDTMSAGLTYDSDTGLSFAPATLSAAGETPDYVLGTASASGWVVTLKPTDAVKGKTITITFQATVDDDAVTDVSKENEIKLEYGTHYTMTDTVNYKTHYAGLVKYDASVEADIYKSESLMEGVKFDFFIGEGDDRTPFNVKKDDDGYYIPDTSADGSNEVETDANGMIYFRGLDNEKTYSLTETATVDGFNMLAEDVPLTPLKEDKCTVSGEGSSATTTFDFITDKALAWNETNATASTYPWVKVANLKGTVLPSTGGVGTTIFYVLGGVLVVGAAVLLVARKRVSE